MERKKAVIKEIRQKESMVEGVNLRLTKGKS
jgi:hypothetical protein